MRKTILIISILVALTALTVGIVMAQSDNPETPDYPGFPGFHGGMMGGHHGAGEGYMAEYMHEAFAEALGISEEEFETRMYAGESLWDIAGSLGFDTDEIAELHNQVRQQAFEAAYADGFIDEDHYEFMQERMSGEFGYGMFGGGYGMHGGGYGRGGGGCHGTYQEAPSE